MPLLSGKRDIGPNITTEKAAGKPPEQALAIALSKAYGPKKRTAGGSVALALKLGGQASGGHAGPLPGDTPGRADTVSTTVKNGAHIIPADVVSFLGQGNTDNGYLVLEKMFPHSKRRAGGGAVAQMPRISLEPRLIIPKPHLLPNMKPMGAPHMGAPNMPHPGKMPLAAGGAPGQVPVKLSHGEFSVEPEDVASVMGHGDLENGHEALDKWIVSKRKECISRLRSLPKPVGMK